MSDKTKIEWCDHSFSPWWGCTKVSPGCDHCYAEAFDHRLGGAHWGPGAERLTFGEKHWDEPKKWNAQAEKLGLRRRVFCSSMADVFDAEAPTGELGKLWPLIRATPMLDWLLLTKRIERARSCLPDDWGPGYPNVWLGATAEDQEQADRRIPRLLAVPAFVHFLSCEPLLGPIDVFRKFSGLTPPKIDWVIAGGESGPGARPPHPDWIRSLRDQCRKGGAAFFFKQWGSWAEVPFDRDYPMSKSPRERWLNIIGGHGFHGERVVRMRRGDKAANGRKLDGQLWDEFPRSNNQLIHQELVERQAR